MKTAFYYAVLLALVLGVHEPTIKHLHYPINLIGYVFIHTKPMPEGNLSS